MDTHISLNHEQ